MTDATDRRHHCSPVLQRLPPDIQTILRRKCSRDPSTRFTHKIEILLSYVLYNPHMEDELGLGWFSDNEFRLNKKTLSDLLGIKMNSMNVNLRDLGFRKIQHETDGWTRWTRNGFTQKKIVMGPQPAHLHHPHRVASIEHPNLPSNLTLGCVLKATCSSFIVNMWSLWSRLFGEGGSGQVATDEFVRKLAAELRHPEQSMKNAVEVVGSIVAHDRQPVLGFVDLVKFMAKFGPGDSVMIKIAALLSCTNTTKNWVFFNPPRREDVSHLPYYVILDDNELNCFRFEFNRNVARVWNVPLIDAFGCYLVDEHMRLYSSWMQFIEEQMSAIKC